MCDCLAIGTYASGLYPARTTFDAGALNSIRAKIASLMIVGDLDGAWRMAEAASAAIVAPGTRTEVDG